MPEPNDPLFIIEKMNEKLGLRDLVYEGPEKIKDPEYTKIKYLLCSCPIKSPSESCADPFPCSLGNGMLEFKIIVIVAEDYKNPVIEFKSFIEECEKCSEYKKNILDVKEKIEKFEF